MEKMAFSRPLILVLGVLLLAWNLPEFAQGQSTSISNSVNRFSVNFWKAVQSPSKNVFFCPLSISVIFGILQSGARGSTAREIAAALQFNDNSVLTEAMFHELLRSYRNRLHRGLLQDSFDLRIANLALIQYTFPIRPEFNATLLDMYYAAIGEVDFTGSQAEAMQGVNRWVSDKTRGKITTLFDSPMSSSTKMALLSAIYFSGRWIEPFDPSKTAQRSFRNADNSATSVPMMHAVGFRKYAKSSSMGLMTIELPYHGNISMFVFLPLSGQNGNINEVMKSIDHEELVTFCDSVKTRKMNFTMPRFEVTYKMRLRKPMRALGLRKVWTEQADLSGITSSNEDRLRLSKAVHKAVIEVNEQGTTATGSTGLEVGSRQKAVEFHVDQPFAFIIKDRLTTVNLFIGVVNRL